MSSGAPSCMWRGVGVFFFHGRLIAVFALPTTVSTSVTSSQLLLGTAPGLGDVGVAQPVVTDHLPNSLSVVISKLLLAPGLPSCTPFYACLTLDVDVGSSCLVCTETPAYADVDPPSTVHSNVWVFTDPVNVVSTLEATGALVSGPWHHALVVVWLWRRFERRCVGRWMDLGSSARHIGAICVVGVMRAIGWCRVCAPALAAASRNRWCSPADRVCLPAVLTDGGVDGVR